MKFLNIKSFFLFDCLLTSLIFLNQKPETIFIFPFWVGSDISSMTGCLGAVSVNDYFEISFTPITVDIFDWTEGFESLQKDITEYLLSSFPKGVTETSAQS